MSNKISLCSAYRLARKFYRREWMGLAQYHLSAVGERDDVWVIAFIPFIPYPVFRLPLSYDNCELANMKGIIPVIYDSNPKWIEVNKNTGACRKVSYFWDEWFSGAGKMYADSLTWHDQQMLFDYRIGKGKGFNLIIEDKSSSCHHQK